MMINKSEYFDLFDLKFLKVNTTDSLTGLTKFDYGPEIRRGTMHLLRELDQKVFLDCKIEKNIIKKREKHLFLPTKILRVIRNMHMMASDKASLL